MVSTCWTCQWTTTGHRKVPLWNDGHFATVRKRGAVFDESEEQKGPIIYVNPDKIAPGATIDAPKMKVKILAKTSFEHPDGPSFADELDHRVVDGLVLGGK